MITVSKLLSRTPPLFSGLAKIIAGDIDCSISSLQEYSRDGSLYQISPQAIIYPKNATDIKHVISFSREYNMPITTRGSGSSRTGGSLGEGIILDMTRHFNHIRHMAMMDNTITVDAGVSVKTLRQKLHGLHFDIPVLTAQDNDSTVGGVIATKNVNPSSFHFGTIREWVQSLTVIVDTGEEHNIADGITPSGRLLGIYQAIFPLLSKRAPLIRAAKPENSDDPTGYSIWNTSIGPRQLIDQLVGSEGTLGIITSVTLRVIPLASHHMTTCIPIDSSELMAEYIALAKEHRAESIFLYDEAFSQLSKRYYDGLAPHFENTPYTLLISHTATSEEKLHSLVRTFKRSLPIDESRLLFIEDKHKVDKITEKTFLYSLFDSYTKKTQTPVSLADGIIVDPKDYTPLLSLLEPYLYSLGKLYTITGNAGSGHIAIVTLFDQKSPRYERDLDSYRETIYSYVQNFKGGISASGGEGIIRAPFLSYCYNEATLSIFKEIKDAWDPTGILNSGKKLSMSLNYLAEHLSREYETSA